MVDLHGMADLLILVAFALVFFAVGLSGIRFRRLPVRASVLLFVAYLAFVIVYGISVSRCNHCGAGEDPHDGRWLVAAFVDVLAGAFAASLLGVMVLGGLAARFVRWGMLRARAHPPGTVN